MIPALLILGMHRSGTSCLAGLLAAAGAQVPGAAIRNWDNPHGHFEAVAAVRLNEAVLAHSGGHWLKAPQQVRWQSEHAAVRDALLAPIAGAPALLKDPRSLLTAPFWLERADAVRAIGIVRHPLAVARSLVSWRGMDLTEGIELWLAHNRVLLHAPTAAVLDFEAPAEVFLAAVEALIATHPGLAVGGGWRTAYVAERIHHDGVQADDLPNSSALREALELHRALVGDVTSRGRGFPWASLRAFSQHIAAGAADAALAEARGLLATLDEPSAALVACCAVAVRHQVPQVALAILAGEWPVPERLRAVLRGKALLAAGDAEGAVTALTTAVAVDDPDAEAVLLLPDALRRAGQHAQAYASLHAAVERALYPHTVLARLAQWQHADGEISAACATLEAAITAAPPFRRGRLRTRLAGWLRIRGDVAAADRQLACIAGEDPQWAATRGGDRATGAP